MNHNIKRFIDPAINSQGSYLVINNNKAILVDASNAVKPAVKFAKENNINIESLIITHGHWDHILGIDYLVEHFSHVKIYINQWDEDCLFSPFRNLSYKYENHIMFSPTIKNNIVSLRGDSTINLAGLTVNIVHIPGHTPGSQYILINEYNALFVGDTIFVDQIGFHNMDYCDDKYFKKSLQELVSLDENLDVYPGHHLPYVLKKVKEENQVLLDFLQQN